MNNKVQRQLIIRQILISEHIGSQEELLLRLKKQGLELTQATLSRDLKLLQVAKIADVTGSYHYMIPENNVQTEDPRAPERINYLADGFRDIRFSGNLAVVRTLPGYASSIASVIDHDNPWEILGTIAGDDTILIIMKEGITRNDLINTLKRILPFLKNKF